MTQVHEVQNLERCTHVYHKIMLRKDYNPGTAISSVSMEYMKGIPSASEKEIVAGRRLVILVQNGCITETL